MAVTAALVTALFTALVLLGWGVSALPPAAVALTLAACCLGGLALDAAKVRALSAPRRLVARAPPSRAAPCATLGGGNGGVTACGHQPDRANGGRVPRHGLALSQRRLREPGEARGHPARHRADRLRPLRQAKSLRTGKTNVVGVIIPKINSASVSRMVAGITLVLNEAGYQVLLANTDNDASREVDYLHLFSEKSQVDGVILIATVITPEHREAISALPVPIVVLDQDVDLCSCVHQNDRDGMRDVTAVALRDARRPAYIGVFEEDVAVGQMRRAGFLDACAAAGVEVPERAMRIADFTLDSGYEQTEALLEAYPELDAIVCATDSIAYGALTCLREYGHRVPEEVSVTGMDDSEISRSSRPR